MDLDLKEKVVVITGGAKGIGAAIKFGRRDVLVNNARADDRVGLERGSLEKYLKALQRNLLHYYNMAHYSLPAPKKARGCIVNVANKTAAGDQRGTSGYASSKAAIMALTRQWALELLPYGIRVNVVAPAEPMTPLYQQWPNTFLDPEKKFRKAVAKIPRGQRMTRLEEIASMVLFLISNQAEGVTGRHLVVDGSYAQLDRALT